MDRGFSAQRAEELIPNGDCIVSIVAEFQIGRTIVHIRLSTADAERLTELPPSGQASARYLFDSDEFGRPQQRIRSDVISAVDAVINNLSALSPVYNYRLVMTTDTGKMTCSGANLCQNGKTFNVWAGNDRLDLEELELQPDGRLGVVRTIDIRDRNTIESDHFGTVRVQRRKRPNGLLKELESLRTELHSCSEPFVTVTVG